MSVKDLSAYELVKEEDLKGIKSHGMLLKHKKSGARILLIENDDDNKVFNIGFRTPPSDSTGVPHIMEHSVLCGSKNFPAKDPFVELVKGSLNTFLNAMTYPDKTVYPVASCNDKDFQNLMHVYMDAVFYPNIYQHEEIFRQEGWSYKMDSLEDDLAYNGVVYNEMKGAFSSPEGVLDRVVLNTLFPDTSYANESGGDPEVIPELTYEQFLDFHRRYYHPSNSYIYLYGNMDMEEKLNWLDQEYLSKFDYAPVDSKIRYQEPFDKVIEKEMPYSIASDESEEDNTYISYNKVIGTSLDEKLYLAFEVLDYALLSAPGAPLKRALTDAGIGKDIMGSYDNGIYQPIFSVIAKNANVEQKEAFVKVIEDTLKDIVENGMDKKALEAGINYNEFRYREADFGGYPKGLMYGLQIMDSWLYDDEKPFIHIEALDTFEFLKAQVGTGYYEELIRKYLLENTHGAIVLIKPEKGRTARMDKELQEKLQAYKESLTEEERKELQLLDSRFLEKPAFAMEQSVHVANKMAEESKRTLFTAMDLLWNYTEDGAKKVGELENLVDQYEDELGTYLVKLSRQNLSVRDSHTLSIVLHCIGDFERISDHAINIMEAAQEMHDKKLIFSPKAEEELKVFSRAVQDIVEKAYAVFRDQDEKLAQKVEPLEAVVDELNQEVKKRHIHRLREGKCTIELGFILSDITTSLERVADHCSNIAVCVTQVREDTYDTHGYLNSVKNEDSEIFRGLVLEEEEKYLLP